MADRSRQQGEIMKSVHFIVFFFWATQGFGSCVNTQMSVEFLTVALGDSLTLNCTYNCSSGFVRGCWSQASDSSGCLGRLKQGNNCMMSLHLSNVSREDLKKNHTCYTVHTDDIRLPQKIQRFVVLQLQAQTSDPNWTVAPKTQMDNTSCPAHPKDSNGGELAGVKVLAAVTVAVAVLLAALAVYLCLNRHSWNCKGDPVASMSGSPLPPHSVLSPVKGPLSTQSDRVTLRIPIPDNDSDTEVPYADIMITVRGVSTPELTQVGYLTPGDQKERWGNEPRCHLQASRSADRLHVPQPREVSRKMSTNSEYAVITYA